MAQPKEVIVITGCSGRIGTRVAHQFSDSRYVVIGLDSTSPKIASTNFEFIHTDLANEVSLNQAFSRVREKYGEKLATVVHLVTFDMQRTSSLKETELLLKVIQQFHTEQFLFASTVMVHAPCEPGQKINENWPLSAAWGYPQLCLETEEYLQKNHGKIPLVILRIASCYDDGCHLGSLAQQIQRIYEEQISAQFFPGCPLHGKAYIHLDDLTQSIWLAVQRRFGLPHVCTMIVAEPETVSYLELQKVIGLLCHGQECKTYRLPKWLAKLGLWLQTKLPMGEKASVQPYMIDFADLNYSCDITLVQEKLGWSQKHSLRQTLPKMINALKESPLSWYRENALIIPVSMKKS